MPDRSAARREGGKTAAGAALIVVLCFAALGVYVMLTWDRTWDAPLPDIHASADPAIVGRGEYRRHAFPGAAARHHLADMSDDDLTAIVSFLRAQPPVVHKVPDATWTLIGKIVKSLAPAFKPRTAIHAPKTAPASQSTRERGEYLARAVGNCGGCHSPLNQLTFALSGPEFSGGADLEPRDIAGVDRTLWFRPPNLTPLPGSALARFPEGEAIFHGPVDFSRRGVRDGRCQMIAPSL